MVLLGTQALFQPNCCAPLSNSSRISPPRSRDNQSSPGSSRCLAYEAADCGLLSPDLAAGIRRVKGVRKIGVRQGNWLSAEQSQRLWQPPSGERLKEKRDRACAIPERCASFHRRFVASWRTAVFCNGIYG